MLTKRYLGILGFLGLVVFTLVFAHFIIPKLLSEESDFNITLRTTIFTFIAILSVYLIKKASARVSKNETVGILKNVSLAHKLLALILIYLMIIFTVYSLIVF